MAPISNLMGGVSFAHETTKTMTEAENKNVMKPYNFRCNMPPEQM